MVIRRLTIMGYQAPQIAAAIMGEPATAYLLERQGDRVQTIYDDQKIIRAQTAEAMTQMAPLDDLDAYRSQQRVMMERSWEVATDPNASPMERAAFGRLYVETSRNCARAGGIPVDAPAIAIDLKQLIIAGGGQLPGGPIEGEARGSGLVDAYTFATHEDFCGLDLRDKPMQRMILDAFMRAQSPYTELIDICGMRSGKGTIGSVIVWYEIYRLMEIANPQRYYGLTPDQQIGTVNMAMSERQAKNMVFKHLKDRINTGGRWFQELRAFCEQNIPGFANMLEPPSLEIRLPKNLVMRSGHSRAASQVGGTNICVVFDELCKYKTQGGVENAEDVYAQIKASIATFGDDARIVVLSSPEWSGDYGMQLLQMALEREDSPLMDRCPSCRERAEKPDYEASPAASHPRMMGIHMATWEANEGFTQESLWESQNGAANPRAFWRNFGAKPTTAKEGYYPNPERWDQQGDPDLRYPYDKRGQLAEWFRPCCDSRRYAHVDLAVTRDACGLAMAHKPVPGCPWFDTIMDEKAKKRVPNPKARKVVLDVCLQVRPEGDPPEIDFDGIRDYIREWEVRGFPVKAGRVTYDGWQSVDSRQILRREGFKPKEFSLDRNLEGHDTLQELINTEQLAYYPHPVLVREGKSLELKGGRKVDHPDGGSKDVIDAAAGAVYHAYRYGGRKAFVG